MSEQQWAMQLANRILDKPGIDPDGDLCVLARQLCRASERYATLEAECRKFVECVVKHGRWNDQTWDEAIAWLAANRKEEG
jgi:hypothetical protein